MTAGCNEPDPGNHLFRSGALDIIGFNYHDDWFKDVPKNFPGKPFIITESVSALQTRGYYRMPSDSMYVWYLNAGTSLSTTNRLPAHHTTIATCRGVTPMRGQCAMWRIMISSWVSSYGQASTISASRPLTDGTARSSYFGIVDLAGFPKDSYYMYQSRWRPDLDVLHLFPHWNWKEGQEIDVWAYFNNADEVELYLNGESLGAKRPEEGSYHVSWRVPFVPGEPGGSEPKVRARGEARRGAYCIRTVCRETDSRPQRDKCRR